MNQIAKFFDGQQVTILEQQDGPYFKLSDVCRILNLTNPSEVARRVRDKYKAKISLGLSGNAPTFISEHGLYQVIMRADQNKITLDFQDWVYEDVLPSIRKHGVYATPEKMEEMLADPDTMITVLQKLKEERTAKEQAQKQIEADRPKVVFAEALEISQDSILIKELANLLRQKGYDTGEKRLYAWLREKGYLCKKVGEMYNLPTQRALDMGLFEIKKGVRSGNNGAMRQTRTTKVTARGQIYFINKLIGSRIKAI